MPEVFEMGLLLDIFIAFLFLIWLGLMLVNVAGASKKGYAYEKGHEGYSPKALVMLPCKGLDLTLSKNISSLKKQEYKNFFLIGIVDSEDDPAVKVLEEQNVDYIISSAQCSRCSGKVRAIATAMETFDDYEVYVIVDSDVEASPSLLSKLIEPLQDGKIGISTAYPLFNPIGGFWSRVKMAWGFVGNGLMESELTRFAWGGSLAFRKDLLDAEHFKAFKESVSDDIAIARSAKDKKLKIHYVKERLMQVNTNDNFSRFMEWANRQTALSISGSRKIFQYGVVIYSADILLIASSIALSIYVSPALIILFAPFVIGIAKSYMRAGKAYPDLWLIYIFTNFIYLYNLIAASRMHTITWRGGSYEL